MLNKASFFWPSWVLVFFSTLTILVSSACTTTSVKTTVKRAPDLTVYKVKQLALECVSVSGQTEYRTSQACVGESSGVIGPISKDRLALYSQVFGDSIRNVLSENGISVVDRGQAEHVLKINVAVTEKQVAELSRCDRTHAAQFGLNCLPDPVINGKSKCGCSAVRQGELNPANYHWSASIWASLAIQVEASLVNSSGEVESRASFRIQEPVLTGGSIGRCDYVKGKPSVVSRCLSTSVTKKTANEIQINFDPAFKGVFRNTLSSSGGVDTIHNSMFPYDDYVRYKLFRLKEPKETSKAAMNALKDGKFSEAAEILEKELESVMRSDAFSNETRSQYLNNYAVALLGAGKLQEARKAITKAQSLYSDERYETTLKEIDRQIEDTSELLQ